MTQAADDAAVIRRRSTLVPDALRVGTVDLPIALGLLRGDDVAAVVR